VSRGLGGCLVVPQASRYSQPAGQAAYRLRHANAGDGCVDRLGGAVDVNQASPSGCPFCLGHHRQALRRSSCRARGSLDSLRGRRRAAAGWGQEGEAPQPVPRPGGVAASGSGLSTRSPRPSSPRERRGIRPRQEETGKLGLMRQPPLVLRPACPSGTRCRRPTCGAGSPPASGQQRRGLAPCPGAWRCSCPRRAGRTIWCCGSAASGPPHTAPVGPARRRIG
jgi:hypothetical protein